MSPACRLKLIWQKKGKSRISQRLLEEGAREHRQAMQLVLSIHKKQSCQHSKSMQFNERILLPQARMHSKTLKMQCEQWENKSEEIRNFQAAMDGRLSVMESISQTLRHMAHPLQPTLTSPSADNANEDVLATDMAISQGMEKSPKRLPCPNRKYQLED